MCLALLLFSFLAFFGRCLFLFYYAQTTQYDYQVIVVMDSTQSSQKAAEFLCNKHPGCSSIVAWDQETRTFTNNDPDNPQPIDLDITDWKSKRIQVVGHGLGEEIGGYTGDVLAEILIEKLSNNENVKRISIVGCASTTAASAASAAPTFLVKFGEKLKAMGKTETSVTMRSELVLVDQSGRKWTGEKTLLNTGYDTTKNKFDDEVGVMWSHKNACKKWIWDAKGGMRTMDPVATNVSPPKYYGILKKGQPLYVMLANGRYVEITDDHVLEWILQEGGRMYRKIKESQNNEPQHVRESEYDVTKWDGTKVKGIKVREIKSLVDLYKELVYYGEKGCGKPKGGPLKGSGSSGEPVYYRYGDLVYLMEEHNFYIKEYGIIGIDEENDENSKIGRLRKAYEQFLKDDVQKIEEELPNIKEAFRNQLRGAQETLKSGELPEKYHYMRSRMLDGEVVDNIRSWVSGDNENIKSDSIEHVITGKFVLASQLSEGIRNFYTSISNVLDLQLAKDGYISAQEMTVSQPMLFGNTWQVKIEGEKVTGLKIYSSEATGSKRVKATLEFTKDLLVRHIKSILSHTDGISMNQPTEGEVSNSGDLDPEKISDIMNSRLKKFICTNPIDQTENLREYKLKKSSGRLLGTKMQEPEVESVKTQVMREFVRIINVSSVSYFPAELERVTLKVPSLAKTRKCASK